MLSNWISFFEVQAFARAQPERAQRGRWIAAAARGGTTGH
jgi:hypothetical protein